MCYGIPVLNPSSTQFLVHEGHPNLEEVSDVKPKRTKEKTGIGWKSI